MAVSGTTRVWPADGHHHAVEHRQRQRQAEGEGRALAGRELIEMRPPSAWIERLTTSMPTPRPEMSDIGRGGGEARQEDQIVDLLVGQRRVRRDQPLADGDALTRAGGRCRRRRRRPR